MGTKRNELFDFDFGILEISEDWYEKCDCDGGEKKLPCIINGVKRNISKYKVDRLGVINHMALAAIFATSKFRTVKVCYENNCEFIMWEGTNVAISINGDSNTAIVFDMAKAICRKA